MECPLFLRRIVALKFPKYHQNLAAVIHFLLLHAGVGDTLTATRMWIMRFVYRLMLCLIDPAKMDVAHREAFEHEVEDIFSDTSLWDEKRSILAQSLAEVYAAVGDIDIDVDFSTSMVWSASGPFGSIEKKRDTLRNLLATL
jgi:hypothetical protein